MTDEQDPLPQSPALMEQLFMCSAGILFASFLSIGVWTQGVPRLLATLGGFVAGFVLLGSFAVTSVAHRQLEKRATWLAKWIAILIAARCIMAWPLWTASYEWPYAHAVWSVVMGVVAAVVSCGLFFLLVTWSRRLSRPQWRDVVVGLAMAGCVSQVLASTLLVGTPQMWPSHTAERSTEWYIWLSQGVAVTSFAGAALVQTVARGERLTWSQSLLRFKAAATLVIVGCGLSVLAGYTSAVVLLTTHLLLAAWVIATSVD